MEEKKILLTRGSNYSEVFADSFQIYMFSNKVYAELLLCEEIPIIPDEEFVGSTDPDEPIKAVSIERTTLHQGDYHLNRVIRTRVKIPIDGLAKLKSLINQVQEDISKE